MLYFTGDIHGKPIDRFSFGKHPDMRELDENDVMIILGDFGLPFGILDPAREKGWKEAETYYLNWLNNQKYKTIAICGNHDDRDAIARMPIVSAFGAKMRQCMADDIIYNNIFIIDKPCIISVCGRRCLVIPGAESHDINHGILDPYADNYDQKRKYMKSRCMMFRTKHYNWWENEVIDIPAATKIVEDNIDTHFDYILTHEAPSVYYDEVETFFDVHPSEGSQFLNSVVRTVDFDMLLHGHMHRDVIYGPESKIICLYEEIIGDAE